MKVKSKTKNVLAEFSGWYGAIAILLAYALVSFSIISAESFVFQFLNLTGAVGIIIISLHKNVKQSVVLNIFWASVAFIALIKVMFR